MADPLPPREPLFARARILPAIIVGLAGATLVGGAAFIGVDKGDVLADGRALVESFYANRDAGAVMDRLVPGSLPETDLAQLEQSVQAVLDQGAEVTDALLVTVRDVELAQVTTTDDLAWCVRPDERVLLSCRVALAPVRLPGADGPLEVSYGQFDVYADRSELVVVLSAGDQPYRFGGQLRLLQGGEPVELERQAIALVAQGQSFEVDEADLRIEPGYGLLLVYGGPGAEAAGIAPGELELRWGDGALPLEVAEPTWFVG